MAFTTPCFIRKNTPELREKLEKLGYKTTERVDFEGIKINEPTKNGLYRTVYHRFTSKEEAEKFGYIDCGENEVLFLALAALRDDSDDDNQWFTNSDNSTWVKFSNATINGDPVNAEDLWPDYHKATPEELIEHFK